MCGASDSTDVTTPVHIGSTLEYTDPCQKDIECQPHFKSLQQKVLKLSIPKNPSRNPSLLKVIRHSVWLSLFVRQYVVVAFNINNHYVLFFELVSTEAVVEFY